MIGCGIFVHGLSIHSSQPERIKPGTPIPHEERKVSVIFQGHSFIYNLDGETVLITNKG